MSDAAQTSEDAVLLPFVRCVGLIGDVHGEASALAAVLEFLRNEPGLDALLCTGDLPGKKGFGDPESCCRLLEEAGVRTIRGNHDRWHFENAHLRELLGQDTNPLSREARWFLLRLPPTIAFSTPRGPLLLCHGMGTDDMAGIYPSGDDSAIARALETYGLTDYRVIVAGHTHRRMVRIVEETILLNPGSLYWEDDPGFLIADFVRHQVRVFLLEPFTNRITEADPIPLPEAKV